MPRRLPHEAFHLVPHCADRAHAGQVVPLAAQNTECEAGFRLFDHELLATDPVCVPENPQRIAMMDTIGIELMFVLDTPPAVQIGAYTDQLLMNFPALEEEVTLFFESIPDVGFPSPNPEVILQAQPDLIVIYDFAMQFADQLNAIAPTVFVQLLPGVDLELAFDFHAQLLGLEDEVATLLATYGERTAALGMLIDEPIAEQSIVVARLDAAGLSFFATNPAYAVLNDLGWNPSEEFSETLANINTEFAFGLRPVTLEELPLLNGDYLFVYFVAEGITPDELNTQLDDIMMNPLWLALPVVQNERVFRVPPYWNFNGIISAHHIIDDLFRYVAGVDPAEVSPNPFLTTETEATPETTPSN
jgi:iron complex transport system substrate-binding protein